MEIKYTARHFQVDDRVKDFATGKVSKLNRFLDEPIAQLTLETEKRRQIAELHVTHRHGTLQATEEAEQMFDAIQAVVDKVEKQARRSRKKYQHNKRRAQRSVHEEDHHWPFDVVEGASFATPQGPKIIKTGRLPIKPMTIDEAALGLAASKNEFFVFRDSVSDKVSVLYRRNDGHYGLIAPDF